MVRDFYDTLYIAVQLVELALKSPHEVVSSKATRPGFRVNFSCFFLVNLLYKLINS